jgi:hypothetical protein
MRNLLAFVAAVAVVALSGPAVALGGGDPAVNGSVSPTPPGQASPYRPYAEAPGWRHRDYWRAPRGDGLPRYAQSTHDYYWPGPQDWQGFGPGPL